MAAIGTEASFSWTLGSDNDASVASAPPSSTFTLNLLQRLAMLAFGGDVSYTNHLVNQLVKRGDLCGFAIFKALGDDVLLKGWATVYSHCIYLS